MRSAGHQNLENPESRELDTQASVQLVALLFLVQFADGIDMHALAFVAAPVRAEFGIDHTVLGLCIGAAFLGMALGAMLFGWLADRYSRKAMLIIVVTSFGLSSLATVQSIDGPTLFVCRFLTGLALGGVYPIASALVIGSVAKANRTALITIMSVGSAAGAAACGLITAELTSRFGWRAMFVVGGVLPILLLPLLHRCISEPSRAVVTKRDRAIAGAMSGASVLGRAWRVTFPLWGSFLFCSIPVFFLVGWLPTIASESGASISQAAWGSSLFALSGAVGGIAGGKAVDKFGLRSLPVIATASMFSGLVLAATIETSLFIFGCVLAGAFMIGLLNTLAAVAGQLYPDETRSFGTGCALAVMRAGAAFAPWIGGVGLDMMVAPTTLVASVAAPLLLSGVLTFAFRNSPLVRDRNT